MEVRVHRQEILTILETFPRLIWFICYVVMAVGTKRKRKRWIYFRNRTPKTPSIRKIIRKINELVGWSSMLYIKWNVVFTRFKFYLFGHHANLDWIFCFQKFESKLLNRTYQNRQPITFLPCGISDNLPPLIKVRFSRSFPFNFVSCISSFLGRGIIRASPQTIIKEVSNPASRFIYDRMLKVGLMLCRNAEYTRIIPEF